MDFYWRLKNIPELQKAPPSRRRWLWNEAVSRSFAVRYLLFMLLTIMLGFAVCALALHMLWPAADIWLWSIMWMPFGGVLNDFAMTQPRARRWLRTHASELDNYELS